MRNNNKNNHNYNIKYKRDFIALERKIFIYIALIMASAALAVFILQSLARGFAGNFIVNVLQGFFNISYSSAMEFYQRVVRNNVEYIQFGAIIVFFLVLLRFLLSRFSMYFMEVSDGLDTLTGIKTGEIALSPEMSAMERKIKLIKQTLETREQETLSAERRKNDMVMYLAHDIKTPLTTVIGYLSLLDEAPDMPPDQKVKYVNIALNKANRLEKLVDEFFDITRYNFQAGLLSKTSIDLFYMMAQMTDEFYPLLAANGKQAILHIPDDMAIYGDPDMLARVFNNILKNAITYSPENSVIDINASVLDDMASIVFTNEGSIPENKLATIFDKYYRLDSARSSDTGGAGLGLAIAKEIIVSHGGRINADAKDNRISITVELPAIRQARANSS